MNTIAVPLTINWKKNLFFVWISQFLAMIGFGCCMPFIPLYLREHFHIVDNQLRGFYVSLFYLAGITSLCIATTVWGMLADRFGRKLMLLRASYGAAILYPLLVFAPNFQVMLLIRFLCSFFRERSIRRKLCWYARRLQKNTVSCSARSAPPSGAETWSAT